MEQEIEIKKSKFVAYSFELETIEDVKKQLDFLHTKHKKATHICYAYVFNKQQNSEKCFDDGEPSGTAGYPILNVIKKKNLKNTLIVVVRYFGGIKLGAGGLSRAYTKAAASVV